MTGVASWLSGVTHSRDSIYKMTVVLTRSSKALLTLFSFELSSGTVWGSIYCVPMEPVPLDF